MSAGLTRTKLILALFALAACGGTDTGGDAGSGLDGPDRQVAWNREPLYEVGGADAEGWAAFGDISDVGFDADGNLYVLDSQASQIHVLAPDGSLLRSMGTPGQGPGELGQVRGMTVFPDGVVAVFDISKFGMVVYGPDGNWMRDVRIDPAETGLLSPPFLPLQARTLLAQVGGRISTRPDAQPSEPGRPIVAVPLEEEAGDPAVILRAWEAPDPGESGDESSLKSESGASVTFRMSRLRGFTPEVRLAALRDGRILTVDSTTYRIDVYSPDGTFANALSRPIMPTPVTPSIEDQERERRLTDLENNSSSGGVRVMVLGGGGGGSMQAPDMTDMMRGRIEDMIFYPEIQVIERIATDWDDRIWIQRASGQPGSPGPTDIITPDGEYLGTLPPDGLRIPRAFGPGGLAVWIERDEYDAERLVVARIAPAR